MQAHLALNLLVMLVLHLLNRCRMLSPCFQQFVFELCSLAIADFVISAQCSFLVLLDDGCMVDLKLLQLLFVERLLVSKFLDQLELKLLYFKLPLLFVLFYDRSGK